jgi:hypothetical protein
MPCRYEGGQAEFARVLFGAPTAMLLFVQPACTGQKCWSTFHCLPSYHLLDRRPHRAHACYVLHACHAADFNLMKLPASGEDEK